MQANPIPRWTALDHDPQRPAQARALAWLADSLDRDPRTLALVRDGHGRPCLQVDVDGDGIPDIDLNWSHSGELLLLAMGEGQRVGIDVERVRRRPRALDIARRFFHPDEVQWLQAQASDALAAAFTRLWCAKEALLKAHGRGIAFGLHRFALGERDGRLQLLAGCDGLAPADGWQLHELATRAGYHAALAWRPRRNRPVSAHTSATTR
ncbi:MAG: 4'-phosphopantetheinyl transferase superfamily protein [Pseudoxanthomonas suwonensis]|nr:4'-phosphopantetheinyl transferase superfamily protein [Pseudoxanthomonas suwonensis]